MRLDRVLAIALRDLRMEFSGRKGWILPLVAIIILAPMSLAPNLEETRVDTSRIFVSGDVPPEVLAVDRVVMGEEGDRIVLHFDAPSPQNNDQLTIHGAFVPQVIRDALEENAETLKTEVVEAYVITPPNRSLFLALVAASILTGSISQSIPGERTNNTLQGLLTASISHGELVVGKWLAWSGFGGVAALGAMLMTVLLGRQDAGWWILPGPTVSMGTVALGFFLVRRANDVIGGATVAIRVLPAALTLSGLAAFYLGTIHPLWGAVVPLGGALVAAGDTWPGALPCLVAMASTLSVTAAMLYATARDIADSERATDDRSIRGSIMTTGTAVLGWWACTLGPLLWVAGGNPYLAEALPRSTGVLAGISCLWLLLLVRAGRALRPSETLGWTWPRGQTWVVAGAAGVVLALSSAIPGLTPSPTGVVLAEARERLAEAMQPENIGLLILVVAAQETVFRGILRRHLGDVWSIVAFAIVFAPLDPLHGLTVGALCTAVTRFAHGSIYPAVLARLIWGVLPLIALPPIAGLLVSALAVAALWMWTAPPSQHVEPVPAG